jgi:hypothetical protein
MTPAMRRSALGIRFTKKQLNELRKVWEDEAWDDIKDDPKNTSDEESLSSDDGSDWEDADGEDDTDGEDEADEDQEADTDDEKDEDQNGWATDESEDESILNTTFDVDKLAELAFRLSIFFITEGFTDGQPSSSLLVYYSGVLGCSNDGSTFRRPRDYTSHLSALIYVQRLLLLEFALPYRAYTYVELPRRSRHGQLDCLNKVRLECMVYG